MVITRTGETKPVGRVGDKFVLISAGENAKSFQDRRDVRPFQAVVAVLSLGVNFDKALGQEAAQMRACGGRTDSGDDGKLRTGAGVPVGQRVKHVGTGWITNGRSDPGNRGVMMPFNIHTSIIDEACMSGK